MPLFDPTFYNHEQQPIKEIERQPTEPDDNNNIFWAVSAVIFGILVIFLLPYIPTEWRMK